MSRRCRLGGFKTDLHTLERKKRATLERSFQKPVYGRICHAEFQHHPTRQSSTCDRHDHRTRRTQSRWTQASQCVIRNVGTFGVPGNTSRTDALEKKPDATRAQGRGGFNVPSLYGLALGAPYLHHGQANTLEALFDDPKWVLHLRAGNPNFLKTGNAVQQKNDLIAFLYAFRLIR